ncbi:MAG: HAMP domain-containing sensor histidine kinase [Eubacteriales bacterium]|nr:HAMP domain-containing sensor histidine kinase [Eubacteriales bacterium]
MKLWLKVSLLALILVVFATGACSLIMLVRSGESNLALSVQNTLTNQQVRAASWSTAMTSELDSQYTAVAKRSLARYLIAKFAEGTTILLSGDDTIYNGTSIDPTNYLPITADTQQYVVAEIGGRSLLLAGSRVTVDSTDYLLYVISDITSVYTSVETMAHQFALVNFGVIALAGGLLILLLRAVLRPIRTLQKNTAYLAGGVYDKRIRITQDDEIGELAADFNRMADAVETHVDALKQEAERRTMFMSALTHEMKTPVTGISGIAQTLLATKMTEEEREDALLGINSECLRIERLSQKLMQLIVLKQDGELVLRPASVALLLETVRASSAELLHRRGVTLSIQNEMDTMPMEPDLMASLLLNLIDNAGKASRPGDTIELSARGNTLFVRDHGCGMPKEELDKITQPFYRIDRSRSKKAGGIGLGLALAEEIARLHHARLEFLSEPGAGTTVKVVFQNVS